MPKIFISYRRNDSGDATGRLHDRLRARFSEGTIFYDIHSIPMGIDFRKYIDDEVSRCDVMLAVIGDDWETISENGQRRLDNPNDLVRLEIETALARGIPVVPVLVSQARMPEELSLPGDLGKLVRRNAAIVRSGADFDDHVNRLIKELERLFALKNELSEQHPDAKRIAAVDSTNSQMQPRFELLTGRIAKRMKQHYLIGSAIAAGILIIATLVALLNHPNHHESKRTTQIPEPSRQAITVVPTVEVDDIAKNALLIAVSEYEDIHLNDPPLKYPEEDAKALGNVLKNAGYNVTLLLGQDATNEKISSEFWQIAQTGRSDGLVLIGFFGHGAELEIRDDHLGDAAKVTCFCPFDTKLRRVNDMRRANLFDKRGQPLLEPDPDSLVKITNVMSTLKQAKAGNRFVLWDCCHVVANQARGTAFGSLRVMDMPTNTSILFSCSPDEIAFELPERGHGAFTAALLESLEDLSLKGTVDTSGLALDTIPFNES